MENSAKFDHVEKKPDRHFPRPSHFYKKPNFREGEEKGGLFLTSANLEGTVPQKRPRVDKNDRTLTFENNSFCENDPLKNSINILASLKIQLPQEEIKTVIHHDPTKRKNYTRRKYEKLIKTLSFLNEDDNDPNYKYNFFGILPYVFFFKYLAQNNFENENEDCLKLNIPDTIIINEEDYPPTWFYTSKSGFVHKTENFLLKDILERLGISDTPDELVAVLKKPRHENQNLVGNETKLFSTRDLNLWCDGFLLGKRGEMNVIQRYVKPKGPKAFVNRSVWRRDGRSYAWIITNKNGFNPKDITNKKQLEYNIYCTNFKVINSCSLIQIKNGKILDDTLLFLQNIVRYFEDHKKIKFDELIADFIKDESETLWMIDVKGFIISDPKYMKGDTILNYVQDFKTKRDISVMIVNSMVDGINEIAPTQKGNISKNKKVQIL